MNPPPPPSEGGVEKLLETDVGCRSDIDRLEQVIRGCTNASGRCSILETAAYMMVRMTLLRWVSDHEGRLQRDENEVMRFHIGGGISIRGEYDRGGLTPPRIVVSWRHGDNDGALPVAISKKNVPHKDNNILPKRPRGGVRETTERQCLILYINTPIVDSH